MPTTRSLILYHGYNSFQFGLLENQNIISSAAIEGAKTCTELLPQLDLMFHEAQFSLKDIDYCTIYTGPGSFTALRVAIAFANGFAFAQKIPLIEVTGFEAAKEQHKKSITDHCTIIAFKAFGEEVYLQLCNQNNEILFENAIHPKNILELISLLPTTIPWFFVGNGIPLLLEKLGSSLIRHHAENILDLTPFPSIQAVGSCGAKKYLLTKNNTYKAEPLYLKNPPAPQNK